MESFNLAHKVSYAMDKLYHSACHHARRVASSSAGAKRDEHRADMVRRLAAMAEKLQRSSSPPRLVKDLTDALQVRTLYGNAGRRQHGEWGAGSAAGA